MYASGNILVHRTLSSRFLQKTRAKRLKIRGDMARGDEKSALKLFCLQVEEIIFLVLIT
jgi:hypothetical protein